MPALLGTRRAPYLAGAWTPARLPGCVLWLDASSIGQADNTAVASWRDGSGLHNDAGQGTVAHQPTYLAGGLNGRPAVRGDGVDDQFALPSTFSFPAGWYTAWTLRTTYTNASNQAGLTGKWGFGVNFPEWSIGVAVGAVGKLVVAGGGTSGAYVPVTSTATLSDGLAHVVEGWWDRATINAQTDGGGLASAALTAYNANPAGVDLFSGGGAGYIPATVGAGVVYSRCPTAPERARVRAYLAARYQIAVSS